MIKTGLKLAGPIIRGIKGISGKVKAKVAAGKAWVKGKVEAGKQWVKGKASGLAGRGPRAAAEPETDVSRDVKAAAGRELMSRAGADTDVETVRRHADVVLNELRPRGLKALKVVTSPQALGRVDVIAAASPPSKVYTARVHATGGPPPFDTVTLAKLPGGQDLLNKLPTVDADKYDSLVMEARIALDAIKRGDPIFAVGRDVPKRSGPGAFTEIDVETDSEMIQIKGGNYATDKKLSGKDMTQFSRTLEYNTKMRFAPNGDKLAPKQVVYHFTSPPLSGDLRSWLESRGVVVREGRR